jgi:peptidoglycan hydrolase-like protein with peptidoglycan-binding domain
VSHVSPALLVHFSKIQKEKEETTMKSLHFVLCVALLSAAAVSAQSQTPTTTGTSATAAGSETRGSKRGPVFRANKNQIIAAQNMLRSKGVYSGEAIGKLDASTRDSIKSYQKDNGLRATGTLNRATLEKMGIELTEKQKELPVSASSYASADSPKGNAKPRRAVFRATKEQIIEAQRLLKTGGMYAGEESGKLDDPTREGLKKYQEAKGLKATGTLNQVTLEKMGIALTDKQTSSDDSR